jgi:DNA-binding NarL/FixJ family response regulator
MAVRPLLALDAAPRWLLRAMQSETTDLDLSARKGSLVTTRILLVDDHPIVREGLRTVLLRRTGWEVVGEASNGVEALEKAGSLLPDIMVLDITMPKMNGLEVCRLVRKKIPTLEVLFVTQHDSPQMMREALNAGAKGYVVKSNAARDLLEAIEIVSQHRVFTSQLGPDSIVSE